MATVRELVTVWGFDIDDKPLKNMEKGVKDISDGLKVVGGIALAAGATLFGMAKSTSLAGEELAKTSEELLITSDALQEYRFAAEQVGLSTEEMDEAFRSLKKTIGEARLGFGSGRTGMELLSRETGVLLDLTGSQEEQFDKIVNSLAKVKDETKRAAIAEQFFGGAGQKISVMLKNGTKDLNAYREEFRELGGVMSKDAIEASRQFERAQRQIFAILKGIRNEIGAELLPILNELTAEFKEWFKSNRDLIKQNVKATIRVLVDIFKTFVIVLKQSFNFVTRLTDRMGGLERVAKMVFKILAAIMALKIATGFGTMVLSAWQLIGVMKKLGTAALIAKTKLLALPLAITAIVAAIALVAEDFASFSEGRDSVVGRIIEGIDEMIKNVKERFGFLGTVIQGALIGILTPVRAVVNGIRSIGTVIDMVKGKVGVLTGLKNIGGRILNTLGIGESVLSGAGMFGLDNTLGSKKMNDARRQARVTGPVTAAPKSITQNQTTNQVEGKFDINVTGLPPEQAQQAARDGFADVFKTTLRQTQRDLTPEVER